MEVRFFFGDSHGYWVLGRAISEGEPYQYGENAKVFRTPGYPILLAPQFWLGGPEPSVMWARAESALFGALAVFCVFWLGSWLFDVRTGMLAACIAAVYPGAVVTGALVLSEAPFAPWMLMHLALWVAACRAGTRTRASLFAFTAGLTAGVAALIRPSWLLFTPFALVIGLAIGPERKRHVRIAAVMLAGLALVMTPWWVRNARVTGHFVATTLQVGASLYDGLNPNADGASDMSFVPGFVESERRHPAGRGGEPTDPFEYRLDLRMRSAAVTWAGQNPGRAAQLALVKLVRMWNLWPNEPSLSTRPVRLAVMLSFVPVLVMALVGAAKTMRRPWPYALCWLPAVYFTLLHVIFVSSIRYRQPAMLPLMVLAAAAVTRQVGRENRNIQECDPSESSGISREPE